MASKTVTRSTDRTIHEVYISFQISQRVFFCLNYSRTMKETVSFPLNSSNDTLIVFLSCMCELISTAGTRHMSSSLYQIRPTYLYDGHPLSKKPSTPKMSLGIAYMTYVPVFAVFRAHTISSHQVMGYFSRTFTFVENDEQTHKLVFCHSKEARTPRVQRATRWASTWRKRECFTVFYRVAVEQTRGAVMDCWNIFTQEMLTSMNIMSLIGFNWKVFVLFPIWKWQASVDTVFSSSNSAIRCQCHDLEKEASYNMIATE